MTEPQFVAIVPWLIMLPIMVPHPLSVALLEMISPLENECVPPLKCNVAGVTPSPTTNGALLATVVDFVSSIPPLNMNCPALLVSRRLSVVILPELITREPLGIPRSALLPPLVTLSEPPVMNTCPVEYEALPIQKLEDRIKLPPVSANIPVALTEFVVSAATSTLAA